MYSKKTKLKIAKKVCFDLVFSYLGGLPDGDRKILIVHLIFYKKTVEEVKAMGDFDINVFVENIITSFIEKEDFSQSVDDISKNALRSFNQYLIEALNDNKDDVMEKFNQMIKHIIDE